MTSRTSADFRRDFRSPVGPPEATGARGLSPVQVEPAHHPRLKFKKLPAHEGLWSMRITNNYRAVGRWRGEVILCFFIGSHADHDRHRCVILLLAHLDVTVDIADFRVICSGLSHGVTGGSYWTAREHIFPWTTRQPRR